MARRPPAPGAPNGTRTASAPSSFEQAFSAIDDCLSKEAGCGTELDYTEQTSWVLFLKYPDGLEDDRAAVAALEGRAYTTILEASYRWSRWAAPNNASGQVDHHAGHCAKSSMGSMACACAPRRRSMSSRFLRRKDQAHGQRRPQRR